MLFQLSLELCKVWGILLMLAFPPKESLQRKSPNLYVGEHFTWCDKDVISCLHIIVRGFDACLIYFLGNPDILSQVSVIVLFHWQKSVTALYFLLPRHFSVYLYVLIYIFNGQWISRHHKNTEGFDVVVLPRAVGPGPSQGSGKRPVCLGVDVNTWRWCCGCAHIKMLCW